MIHVKCGCGKTYDLPDTMTGAIITCEGCGQPYAVQPEVNGQPHPVPVSMMAQQAAYPSPSVPMPPPQTGMSTSTKVILGVVILGVMVIPVISIIAAIAIPSLLRSRVAANETAAMAMCKAFATAEDVYRRTDWNKDMVLEYAQHIGGNDSLLETQAGLGDIGLVDRAFAAAEGDPGMATPKAGYVFKILTQQGANAAGGAQSYLVNGRMIKGFAIVACPAQYDGTGRNTFIINNAGTIFQKDLGYNTAQIVLDMDTFDPDATWVVSE